MAGGIVRDVRTRIWDPYYGNIKNPGNSLRANWAQLLQTSVYVIQNLKTISNCFIGWVCPTLENTNLKALKSKTNDSSRTLYITTRVGQEVAGNSSAGGFAAQTTTP